MATGPTTLSSDDLSKVPNVSTPPIGLLQSIFSIPFYFSTVRYVSRADIAKLLVN